VKAKLLALLVVTAALAVPALALADDAPSPAATACTAEYVHLGADAFKAKYGATEPYAACLKAYGDTTTPPSTAPAPTGAEAICKAEYLHLGADAFKAKYGATEPWGACLKHNGGSTSTPPTTHQPPANGPEAACKAEYLHLGADAFKAKYGASDGIGACVRLHQGTTQNSTVTTIARALCAAEGHSLGNDAFQAKYGQGTAGLAACVKAARSRAQSILAACKSSTTGDALKQCVTAALKTVRVR
jgi:hypothetical protein